MIPFFVLLGGVFLFRALGWAGLSIFADWQICLRAALALMLCLTASAHWGKKRIDLVRMVPAAFPYPGLLVTMTGWLEIAAAIGLLIPATARLAGTGLALLLVVLFPANVHAARQRVAIGGRQATPLAIRAPLQILFILAALAAAWGIPELGIRTGR